MPTISYELTTPSNYTYPATVVVSGGVASLVSLDTPTVSTEDFNDGTGLTFGAEVEISGGAQAQLVLADDTGLTFNEDFADDTDFTYTSAYSEFSGGQVQQINTRVDATCAATYTTDVNLDWGDGTLTGTATGGAAVAGGKLDLKYGDLRYVDYAATGNAASQQTGCIRAKITPNYSGSPATNQVFILITKASGDGTNGLIFFHKTTGDVSLVCNDSTGTPIFNVDLGSWSPTASTEYEFEYNYDITGGASRLFIDGTQFGGTQTATGTRDSSIALLRVGTSTGGTLTSNFEVDELIVFDTVQHTTDYTPAAYLFATQYVGDVITLPTMTYSDAGDIQAFTNITSTEANTPRYIVNDQYYSGGWTASSDSWATASPLADILTNIATLPAADTVVIKAVTNGGISQMSVSDLTLTYTGQIYPTTNPTIDIDAAIVATVTTEAVAAWTSFTETTTETGADLVRYTLSSDDGTTQQYWDGGAWATSSGYAQSNTGADINTNITSFDMVPAGLKIRIYLHSDDGTTTPSIGNLVTGYNDFIYPVTNPAITPVSTFGTDDITAFASTVVEAGSDLVSFVIEISGINYYHTGAAWAASSGYAQSNTSAEINANIGSLVTGGVTAKPIVYLHSDDGSTTPQLDIMALTYSLYNPADTLPTLCEVSGYLINASGVAISGGTVTATPNPSGDLTTNYWVSKGVVSVTSDSDGYFELSLMPSAEYEATTTYVLEVTVPGVTAAVAKRSVTIPSQASIDFKDL